MQLGDLICCLYDEYRGLYGDNDLAALAADVELNYLLLLNGVRGPCLKGEALLRVLSDEGNQRFPLETDIDVLAEYSGSLHLAPV